MPTSVRVSVRIEEKKEVAILSPLSKWLWSREDIDEVEKEAERLVDSGIRRLVINCREVLGIDAVGLAMFFVTDGMLERVNGKKLALCNVDPKVEDLGPGAVAPLSKLFNIYPNQPAAVAAFEAGLQERK